MNKIICLINTIVLLIFCHLQSCAQKNKEAYTTVLTTQDSLLFIKYNVKAGEYSLFSAKRGLYIDSALKILPHIPFLWQQRSMPYFKQKKYELGMPYLDSAVKYDNTNHFLEYRAFIKCIFQKNYTASIIDFKEAKFKDPNGIIMDHPFDFYLGLCYLQLNQFDSAKLSFTRTINHERKLFNSVHFMTLFYMGITQYEKEDYKSATSYLDSCLNIYIHFSDAQYYKSICFYNSSKKKEALELAELANKNLSDGYTINEDNVIYESYPYQINKFYLESYIKKLKTELEK